MKTFSIILIILHIGFIVKNCIYNEPLLAAFSGLVIGLLIGSLVLSHFLSKIKESLK